jgi:hypothetical protein
MSCPSRSKANFDFGEPINHPYMIVENILDVIYELFFCAASSNAMAQIEATGYFEFQ